MNVETAPVRTWTMTSVILENGTRFEVHSDGQVAGLSGVIVLNIDVIKPDDYVMCAADDGSCICRGSRVARVIRYY